MVPLPEKKGSRQTSDINNRYLYLQDSSEKQNRKTLYIIELSPMITEDCGASKLESEESWWCNPVRVLRPKNQASQCSKIQTEGRTKMKILCPRWNNKAEKNIQWVCLSTLCCSIQALNTLFNAHLNLRRAFHTSESTATLT